MASVALDIAIELIIPDNTAYTVLVALQRLGYRDLRAVQRADHLTIVPAAAAPDPAEIIAQLTRAEVIFNPNKHRLSYAVVGAATPYVESELEALVRDNDDNSQRLQRLLATTFAMPYIATIDRGVAWRLHDDAGPASAQRLEWACQSLLSNAVSQTYQVRPRLQRSVFGEELQGATNSRR